MAEVIKRFSFVNNFRSNASQRRHHAQLARYVLTSQRESRVGGFRREKQILHMRIKKLKMLTNFVAAPRNCIYIFSTFIFQLNSTKFIKTARSV